MVVTQVRQILYLYYPEGGARWIFSIHPAELGEYWKILPSWASNTGEFKFNNIIFSNWHWHFYMSRIATSTTPPGLIQESSSSTRTVVSAYYYESNNALNDKQLHFFPITLFQKARLFDKDKLKNYLILDFSPKLLLTPGLELLYFTWVKGGLSTWY